MFSQFFHDHAVQIRFSGRPFSHIDTGNLFLSVSDCREHRALCRSALINHKPFDIPGIDIVASSNDQFFFSSGNKKITAGKKTSEIS